MFINMHVLEEDLRDVVVGARIISDPNRQAFASPRLYEHGETLKPGYAYIAQADELPAIPQIEGIPSIVCIGNVPPAYEKADIDLLVVSDDVDPKKLLGRIAELFDYYERWMADLQQLVDENAPLEEFGMRSVPIFENPLYCQASGFKCEFLCLGEIEKAPEEMRRWMNYVFGDYADIKAGGYLPIEVVDRLLADPHYSEASNADGPVILHYPDSPGEMGFVNIGPAGAYIARICVYGACHALNSRDMALLCVLARLIALGMRAHNPNAFDEPSALELIAIDLLSGNMPPVENMRRALADNAWRIEDRYFCMTVESVSEDSSWQTLKTIALLLSGELPEHLHFVFENHLVYIFDLSKLGLEGEGVLALVKPAFRDAMLRAGSSEPVNGFMQLRECHWQAESASVIGARINPGFWYHRYRDCNLLAMLERCKGDFSCETFLPWGLKALMAYDAGHGTELVDTLKAYLACNCGIVQTSGLTYVSRSTCTYRVRRISEIANIDFDDANERLEYSIAFALLDNLS